MKAIVTVMPKEQVLDPQGKAVLGGLHALGLDAATDVRQGKVFAITLTATTSNPEAALKEMATKLLANPVMETYHIEFVQDGRA